MCMMSLTPRPTPHRAVSVFRWTNPETACPGLVREAAPTQSFGTNDQTTPPYRDRRGRALKLHDRRAALLAAVAVILAREVMVIGAHGLKTNDKIVRALTGRDGYVVAVQLLGLMERDADLARKGDDQGVGIEQLREMMDYARNRD